MSVDIGEEILKEIRSGFAKELKNKNSGLAKIISKAENGKASFNDVSELSTQCGDVLARLIAEIVTPEILPNGRMYYNIANTFLTGSLRDNYDLLNVTAQAVQEKEDQKIGINIEPQKADFPTKRVNTIVNAVSDETADWETIQRRLDAPVRNVTESFYNDYVKENADFRSNAGLKAYVIRETDGNCCAWCTSLAGRYEYPNDVPPDVYARHDNCTCTVTYINYKQRQDVWSKKSYALTPEERKEILARTPKPERFTPEKAKEVQENNLKGVVKAGNGGIINTREFRPLESDRVVNILRSESEKWIRGLSSEELRAVQKYTRNSGDDKGNEFFRRLNAMLRGDVPKDETLMYYSEQISNALKKNKLEHDIVCYRSIDVNPLKGLSVGDIYEPKQFLSTSVTKGGALDRDYKMIISVPQNSNGAYIEKLSKYPNQREFLLDKDCKYTISYIRGNRIGLEVLV